MFPVVNVDVRGYNETQAILLPRLLRLSYPVDAHGLRKRADC